MNQKHRQWKIEAERENMNKMSADERIDSLSEALRVLVDKITELTTQAEKQAEQIADLDRKMEMMAVYIETRPVGLA